LNTQLDTQIQSEALELQSAEQLVDLSVEVLAQIGGGSLIVDY
jgi:hypothetical protein